MDLENWKREFPDGEVPYAPRCRHFENAYGWSGVKPHAVENAERGYAVEAAMMARMKWYPVHESGYDAVDPDSDDNVEICHTISEYASGRPGRLRVTKTQAAEANRFAWTVIDRNTWTVVWQADYDRYAITDVLDRYCERIPWTAVQEEIDSQKYVTQYYHYDRRPR